ncbi:hypothetical protein EDD85DRAFT_955454 [Armillaria nabsnona]|nr:hypothetical protein EDD85DRAFT_955454 [Armillaria nabsnona]
MSRLHCMPHTVHLAALKLLEGIGAISKKQAKKASSRSSNYQDSATAPVDRSNDDEAAIQDEPEDNEADFKSNLSFDIFSGVNKLCKIVHTDAMQATNDEDHAVTEQLDSISCNERALMLILDVCTRWLSTHQMIRCALDYHETIDEFVSSIRDFCDDKLLTSEDWDAIELVTGWLKAFWVATTDMSTMKR